MKRINTLLSVPILLLFLACQNEQLILIENNGLTQGTTYHIVYESPDSSNYHKAIDSLLIEFDFSLSTYNENSLISAINMSDTGGFVDNHFKNVYLQALETHYASKKMFDITIAPLISAYGFGPGKPIALDSAKVDSMLQYIGMDNIKLDGNKLSKYNQRVKMDVNALAQGYSVDLLAAFLNEKGIQNYLVEIGGEVIARGQKGDKLWRVGIDKPIEGNFNPGENLQAIVQLQNKALATSGNYRKYHEENGKKLVHTINPLTGYPEQHNLLSATILSSSCMTADAYATACMLIGTEESKKLLNKNTELEGYLIYSTDDGQFATYKTPGFDQWLVEEDVSD